MQRPAKVTMLTESAGMVLARLIAHMGEQPPGPIDNPLMSDEFADVIKTAKVIASQADDRVMLARLQAIEDREWQRRQNLWRRQPDDVTS